MAFASVSTRLRRVSNRLWAKRTDKPRVNENSPTMPAVSVEIPDESWDFAGFLAIVPKTGLGGKRK